MQQKTHEKQEKQKTQEKQETQEKNQEKNEPEIQEQKTQEQKTQEQENNIESIFDENNNKWQEIKQSELTNEQILQEEIEKTKDKLLRAKAEIENIKRRSNKEKKEIAKYAITNFAREMLTVADNITRALKSIDEDEKNNSSQTVRNLIIGIEMTEKELYKIFENNQVRKIQAIGEKFDPNFHQAFFKIKTTQYPEGYVAQIINEGFAIEDRVLRPSMVAVAERQQEEEKTQKTDKIDETQFEQKNKNNEKNTLPDDSQQGDNLKAEEKNSKQIYDKKIAEDNEKNTLPDDFQQGDNLKAQEKNSKQIYDKKIAKNNEKNISGFKIDKNA